MALSQPLKMHSLSPRSPVTKSGLHIKHGAVNIHSKFKSLVCQRWAESCCDTCNVIWVSHQSTSDTGVLLLDPWLALQAPDKVVVNSTAADITGTCQSSWGHQGHHRRPGTRSSCSHGAVLFPCHPSIAWALIHSPSVSVMNTRSSV